MKNFTALLILLTMFGCADNAIEKPEKLIDETVMVDIFYDLSLLEAMRTQKPLTLRQHNIDPDKYIYEKYKIDSIQFAQSNRYYASQIETYKKMYEKVSLRLKNKSTQLNPPLKKAASKSEDTTTQK